MTQIVRTTTARHAPLHRLAQSIGCSLGAIRLEMRARKAMRALRELDDHMLTDMGLARGEIALAVRGPLSQANPKPLEDPTRSP